MSSSAPKLQPEPAASTTQSSPFCYADAHSEGGATPAAEQAAEERMRRSESEAFERGRQTAEQQLRATLDAATLRSREQLAHSLYEFATQRAAYYRRIETEVVQLALSIARKILHREAQIDPQMLAGIVRVTLEKLDAGTRVDLYVHPHEATDWRHYFARQMETTPAPEVHEDPSLPAGGCRIETSLGSTEIGTESQLKEIERGLLDLLAERPDPGSSTIPSSNSPVSSAAADRERRG